MPISWLAEAILVEICALKEVTETVALHFADFVKRGMLEAENNGEFRVKLK